MAVASHEQHETQSDSPRSHAHARRDHPRLQGQSIRDGVRAEGLRRLGYREAGPGEAVDLCIVNTCSVTAEGKAKSRKLIRQFARRNPQAEIIVMGCYASRAAEEVAALPGVVEVLCDKRQLPELLARRGLVDVPSGISSFGRRHRAYVKVQDGCAMECSYCIIPHVRPAFPAAIPRTFWRKPAAWWSMGIAKSSSWASTSAITGSHPSSRYLRVPLLACPAVCKRGPAILRHCWASSGTPRRDLCTIMAWSRIPARVPPGGVGRRLSHPHFQPGGGRSLAGTDPHDGRPSPSESAPTCTSPCKAARTRCCGGCGGAGRSRN